MTVVNADTGEVLDPSAAERRAERIRLRLDTIADNYVAVVRLIGEAIEAGDHVALGYRSPGEYVQDRFGGALTGLGVDARRAVVGELSAAGMSTRAIAPVVGVSHEQVRQDAPVKNLTPVTGVDGKTYTRPPALPKPVLAAAAVKEFPDLAHHLEHGRFDDVLRLAAALRAYDKDEQERRLSILRKSIAAEATVDESVIDTYGPAHGVFVAANTAMQAIEKAGGIGVVCAASPDEFTARLWREQFTDLATLANSLARSVK